MLVYLGGHYAAYTLYGLLLFIFLIRRRVSKTFFEKCSEQQQSLKTAQRLYLPINVTVTAPIYFACHTKFSNSVFCFTPLFTVLVWASLCFLIFARLCSTPYFRRNVQLFLLLAEF